MRLFLTVHCSPVEEWESDAVCTENWMVIEKPSTQSRWYLFSLRGNSPLVHLLLSPPSPPPSVPPPLSRPLTLLTFTCRRMGHNHSTQCRGGWGEGLMTTERKWQWQHEDDRSGPQTSMLFLDTQNWINKVELKSCLKWIMKITKEKCKVLVVIF